MNKGYRRGVRARAGPLIATFVLVLVACGDSDRNANRRSTPRPSYGTGSAGPHKKLDARANWVDG
jgi:hypothetical protein